MLYQVKATPNSKRASVVQEGNTLNAKIDAPPREGKANRRLLEILSKHFEVGQNRIRIISGHMSRNKVVEVLVE